MDFELSPDQVALQEAARDLLDDRAGHDQVRAHLESGRPFDENLWKAISGQGWLGIGGGRSPARAGRSSYGTRPFPSEPAGVDGSVCGRASLGGVGGRTGLR